MKKFLLPALTFTLILVGAGCSTTPASDTTEVSTATREQQAYVFCTKKGYTATIRFDSSVNRNRLFCSFGAGKECDAFDYLEGDCDPKTVKVEEDINTSLTPPGERYNCEPIANPVCGTDAKTYTNRCIAEAQGKQIRYEGVCSENDEPFVLNAPPLDPQKTTKPTTSQPSPSKTTTSPTTPTKTPPSSSGSDVNTSPDWVHNLTSLLQSSASPYKITLSQCKEGTKTYYYQKEDCSTCFKILYNVSGESLCYPGLDDTACPVWSEKNCKVIWQK